MSTDKEVEKGDEQQLPYYEYKPDKTNLSDKELIEVLKQELRRVKIQRNDYEQRLLFANRKINRLTTEVQLYENYINRNK